ncbi:hypothetical protein B0J18DRAFT_421459 [Chaetomium sp. MPI-SDFR-AT-0129]|nr:hypothetical protein B0J18DRAFT_421459 [Chaetomium sp. MPI-SDFR-AT-0129]
MANSPPTPRRSAVSFAVLGGLSPGPSNPGTPSPGYSRPTEKPNLDPNTTVTARSTTYTPITNTTRDLSGSTIADRSASPLSLSSLIPLTALRGRSAERRSPRTPTWSIEKNEEIAEVEGTVGMIEGCRLLGVPTEPMGPVPGHRAVHAGTSTSTRTGSRAGPNRNLLPHTTNPPSQG